MLIDVSAVGKYMIPMISFVVASMLFACHLQFLIMLNSNLI